MYIGIGTILENEINGRWYVVEHAGRYMVRARDISDVGRLPHAWISTWGIWSGSLSSNWKIVHGGK